LRVELDDERLAHGNVDVLASRLVEHRDTERVVARFEPRRRETVERVEVVAQHDHPPRLVAHLDNVALAHLVARDRHPPAVDVDVAVADELPALGPARPPSGAEHHVVEPHLEHAEEVLAGDTAPAVGLLVEVAELLLEHAVDAARLLLLAQLEQVLGLTHPAAAVLAGRVRAALDRPLHRVALCALEEQLHLLAPAQPADRTRVAGHQTRRRFGGRQPLCGIGVTSLMPATSMPRFCNDRIAVSRPEPGPFTRTSTLRTPCSIARRAAASAASWEANGVDLREPLKPTLPADAQAMTFPSWSVIDTIVLLNELLMWATAYVMFLRSRRRGRRPPGLGLA